MTPLPAPFPADRAFDALVIATVRRFLAQNAGPPLSPPDEAAFAAGLRAIGDTCGWGNVLSPTVGELSNDRVARWVDDLLGGLATPRPELANLAKQLIKGCLQPAPAECRLSYAEKPPSGECRRQETRVALGRVSGTHCVDCPYWTELTPEAHPRWLAERWHAGPEAFAAAAPVYLPEDFRALRLAAMARARELGGTKPVWT